MWEVLVYEPLLFLEMSLLVMAMEAACFNTL